MVSFISTTNKNNKNNKNDKNNKNKVYKNTIKIQNIKYKTRKYIKKVKKVKKTKHYGNMYGGEYNKKINKIIEQIKENDDTLTTFNFGNYNALDINFENLAEALKINTVFEELIINQLQLNDANIKFICEILQTNTSLVKLDMNSDFLNDENFIKIVSALQNNKNSKISDINFSFNQIGDKGINALAEALKTNETLKTLNISFNHISFESANFLLQELKINKKSSLKYLILSSDKIDNETYEKLLKLKDDYGLKIQLVKSIFDINKSTIKFIPKLLKSKSDTITKENIEFIKNKVEFKPNFNTEESKKKYFDSRVNDLTLDEEFNSLIKNNYDAGINNIKTLPLIDDTNVKVVVHLHGETISSFFKLPDNVNVIFLTPVGYINSINSESFMFYMNNEYMKKFLQDPSCYSKSSYSSFLSDAVIYYGGQYCIDLSLSRKTANENERVTGIHIYNNNNNNNNNNNEIKEYKFSKEPKVFNKYKISTSIDPVLPYLEETINTLDNYDSNNNLSKNRYQNTLSHFLKKYFSNENNKDIKFTIFFTSCRELYEQNNKNVLVFYEQTIKTLNFKVQYDTTQKTKMLQSINDEYNKCFTSSMNFRSITNKSKIQYKKHNNIIKSNNIRSANKITIDDNSKIFFMNTDIEFANSFSEEFIDLFDNNKNNDNEIKNFYTLLMLFGKLKKYINDTINNFDTDKIKKLFNEIYILFFKMSSSLTSEYEHDGIKYYIKLIIYDIINYLFDNKIYGIYFIIFVSDKYENPINFIKNFMKMNKIKHIREIEFKNPEIKNDNEYNSNKYNALLPEYIIDNIIHNITNENLIDELELDILINILQNIKELKLNNKNIDDDGCVGIAKIIENNTNLESINLNNNNMYSKSGIVLAKVLDNKKTFKKLFILENNIGVIGIKALYKLFISDKNKNIEMINCKSQKLKQKYGNNNKLVKTIREVRNNKKLRVFAVD